MKSHMGGLHQFNTDWRCCAICLVWRQLCHNRASPFIGIAFIKDFPIPVISHQTDDCCAHFCKHQESNPDQYSTAQVILRWHIQRGIVSVNRLKLVFWRGTAPRHQCRVSGQIFCQTFQTLTHHLLTLPFYWQEQPVFWPPQRNCLTGRILLLVISMFFSLRYVAHSFIMML